MSSVKLMEQVPRLNPRSELNKLVHWVASKCQFAWTDLQDRGKQLDSMVVIILRNKQGVEEESMMQIHFQALLKN